MSAKATGWALEQTLGDPASKLILVVIGDAMNPSTGNKCWYGQAKLAGLVGVSRSTLQRKLHELEAAGYLTITDKKREDGGRTTNEYRLPLPGSEAGGMPEADGGPASPGEATPASPGEAAYIEPLGEPLEEEASPSLTEEQRERYAVRDVFNAWSALYAPRAVYDEKRAARIRARLRERTNGGESIAEAVASLVTALTNAERDDWLSGRAEKSPGYLTKLDTLLRDAAQVERLLELTAPAPAPDDFDPDEEHLRDLRALHGDDYVPPGEDAEPAAA